MRTTWREQCCGGGKWRLVWGRLGRLKRDELGGARSWLCRWGGHGSTSWDLLLGFCRDIQVKVTHGACQRTVTSDDCFLPVEQLKLLCFSSGCRSPLGSLPSPDCSGSFSCGGSSLFSLVSVICSDAIASSATLGSTGYCNVRT